MFVGIPWSTSSMIFCSCLNGNHDFVQSFECKPSETLALDATLPTRVVRSWRPSSPHRRGLPCSVARTPLKGPPKFISFLVVNAQPTTLSIPHKGRSNLGRERLAQPCLLATRLILCTAWCESNHPAGEVTGDKRALLSVFPHSLILLR